MIEKQSGAQKSNKEDFHAEINRRLSILLPIFLENRKQNKSVSLKVDKLVLEGKTYTIDTLLKFLKICNKLSLPLERKWVTAFF